jgi:hypothetical protein
LTLRGPWWLGATIGAIVLIVGIVIGTLPLAGAGGLILLISGGRGLLVGR